MSPVHPTIFRLISLTIYLSTVPAVLFSFPIYSFTQPGLLLTVVGLLLGLACEHKLAVLFVHKTSHLCPIPVVRSRSTDTKTVTMVTECQSLSDGPCAGTDYIRIRELAGTDRN